MYVPQTSRIRMFVPIIPPRGVKDVSRYPGEVALVEDYEAADVTTSEGREPEDGEYHPAVWIGRSLTVILDPLKARPGGLAYKPGDYMVWARIDAGPAEIPALRSGRIRIGGPGYPPPTRV